MNKLFLATAFALTANSGFAMDAAQAESDARACMASAMVAAVAKKDPKMEGMALMMAPTFAHGPDGDKAIAAFKRRVAAGEVPTNKDGSPIEPEMMNCFEKYRAAVE